MGLDILRCRYVYVFKPQEKGDNGDNAVKNWKLVNRFPLTIAGNVAEVVRELKSSDSGSSLECRIVITSGAVTMPEEAKEGFFDEIKKKGGIIETPL